MGNLSCFPSEEEKSFAQPPIILLHGAFGSGFDTTGTSLHSGYSFEEFKSYLNQRYGDSRIVVALKYLNFIESVAMPLEKQMPLIKSKILNSIGNSTPWILVGHSQGALLGRCLLQTWKNHKCIKFVSLAGPHQGVYGLGWFSKLPDSRLFKKRPLLQKALKGLLGALEGDVSGMLTGELKVLRCSVHDLWREPEMEIFVKNNEFIPKYNNIVKNNHSYKNNLLHVKDIYLFGSDEDDVVVPTESAFFGYYEGGESRKIVPMEEQEFFKKDTLGLKTMRDEGRLHVIRDDSAEHLDWLKDERLVKKVFQIALRDRIIVDGDNSVLNIKVVLKNNDKGGEDNVGEGEGETYVIQFGTDEKKPSEYSLDFHFKDIEEFSKRKKRVEGMVVFVITLDNDRVIEVFTQPQISAKFEKLAIEEIQRLNK